MHQAIANDSRDTNGGNSIATKGLQEDTLNKCHSHALTQPVES